MTVLPPKRLKLDACQNVTLDVRGTEIKVNKNIVKKRSTFFRDRLDGPDHCNFLTLDEDPEILKKCMSFIHNNNYATEWSSIPSMLQLAESLEIEGFKNEMFVEIGNSLSVETFQEVKEIAKKYNDLKLLERCKSFAVTQFNQFIGHSAFTCLDFDCILAKLKSKDVKITSWTNLYKSIVMWGAGDSCHRSSHFEELFQHMRLEKIPIEYRALNMETQMLINSSEICQDKLYRSYASSFKSPEGFTGLYLFGYRKSQSQAFIPQMARYFTMPQLPNSEMIFGSSVLATQDGYLYALFSKFKGYVKVQRIHFTSEDPVWEKCASATLCHVSTKIPSVNFGGHLYIFDKDKCETYDPSIDKWTPFPAMPTAKNGYCLTVLDDYVYVIGGRQLSADLSTVHKYHPSTSTWFEVPSMCKTRYNATAVTLNGQIYVIGGYPPSSLECYNPKGDLWISLKIPLSSSDLMTDACVANGEIYSIFSEPEKPSIIKMLDLNERSWKKVTVSKETNMTGVIPVRQRKDFDFIIKVGPREIGAHKNVLAEKSDFFKAMFEQPMRESIQGWVEMKEVDFYSLVVSISFMYSMTLPSDFEVNKEMLHVATLLQATDLLEKIYDIMKKKLDVSTFSHTKELANFFNCFSVDALCDEFALNNFQALALKDSFNIFDKEYLEFILCSSEAKTFPETHKYKAIVRWANYLPEERRLPFEDLFSLIDFIKMPEKFVKRVRANEKLIKASKYCSDHVDNSLRQRNRKQEAIFFVDKKSQHWQAYRLNDRRWKKMQKLQRCSSYLIAVSLNNSTYLIQFGSLFLVEFGGKRKTCKLTKKASSPILIDREFTIAHEGYIYVFCKRAFEKYDPTTDEWTSVGNFDEKRKFSVVGLSDHIYVLGGEDRNGQAVGDVIRYNLERKEWDTDSTLPMNVARSRPAAAQFDGRIYVFGGTANGEPLSNVECYDPLLGLWTDMLHMVIPRSSFSVLISEGKMYAVGGTNSSTETMEVYDPGEETWTIEALPDLMTPAVNTIIMLRMKYETLV